MAISHADSSARGGRSVNISALVAIATSLLAILVVLSAVPVMLVHYYF